MSVKRKKKEIFHKVFGEYSKGELNIGKSNKKVKSIKQATAIALSMVKRNKKNKKRRKVK